MTSPCCFLLPWIAALLGGLVKVAGHCFPDVQQWPALEAFWDVFWYPSMCEFTVHQPMAANAYVWGYLAARK